MDSRYADPLDVDALARTAGYSRYHFVRAFRATYGESPGRYLTRRRIERAQELLRSANLTVTEVCHLVGFSSLGSFSSRFRDLTGVSPSQYQRDAHRVAPPPIPGCYVLMWGRPQPGHPKSATTEKPGPAAAG
jgi:AraC-like DNA-binding protein